MKTVVEFLTESKKLIQDPKNWTQGWFAKTEDGLDIDPCDKYAVCFCSLGALERMNGVYNDNSEGEGSDVLMYMSRQALDVAMHSDVTGFNDGHTHEEVMQKWDLAIEWAKIEEVSK